ncbi:uncharacterized protein SPAPADRAFT_51238 [Spathaspora passalidarum NRRL Y-27907]|uniref:D-lactate dehydratase n=1 Tax=Spathaspora passalidarum (strain NRRL Y-27907 / 11-Y1) TaxID=619300 RepID=G3AQX6_SPAPN|nr:uncharacterized protein SPAPADRAFT_51238 [Spathaspora passalidarum NRRL Y-27907]EGW31205.1 hypothetical protein SPAPADRAFT_51238 [Spathaspora passalidarum NRRL Y-27907]
MVKALIAVTSYHGEFYPNGGKTGLFVCEAIEPFLEFRKKGYEVDFASETGTYGLDVHCTHPDYLNGEAKAAFDDPKSEYSVAIANIKKASDVNVDDYDIVFASAGHGTCFDYPTADGLHAIALSTYKRGGVVAAVCHGPLFFDNFNDPATGEPIVKGKKITGFTDEGEEYLGVFNIMKEKNLETVNQMAQKLGATYVAPNGPWDAFAVVDGKIVTGVNPQSAVVTAEKTIETYEAK